MRHSWMKINNGKKECTTCGMVAKAELAGDGYNTIWYYHTRGGEKLTERGNCI